MSDLDRFPTERRSYRVYRLASFPKFRDFVTKVGIDSRGQLDLEAAVVAAGLQYLLRSDPSALLDLPFAKRTFRRRILATRFSDGTYRVFYSSLEIRTAECETVSWATRSYFGQPTSDRQLHYAELNCEFVGNVKDLTVSESLRAKLIAPRDYGYCNRLGADAARRGLDGLVVPSARCIGTNLPVFSRKALRSPAIIAVAVLKWIAESKEAVVRTTSVA